MRPSTAPRTAQYLFPEGAEFGLDNLVLHATGRRHVVKEFTGPLSIKAVVNGQVTWVVDGRSLVVDSCSFLVLNDDQKYSMDIAELQPMETCCAFFARGFAEQVALDATTPLEASLDAPARKPPSLDFLSRLHTDPSGLILPQLRSLAQRCSGELQPSGFEEDFLLLSEKLLLLYREITDEISRVPAAKASTREELFRRLQVAREYIHGCADQPISLEGVARAACVSRYHLHRAFTRVFRQTPHGYLTHIRLERAHAFLKAGRTVTEACVEVGFSSLSSFSRLFRGRYGFPPSSVNSGSDV
jgi:AraC family transcriptional regulator